MRKQYEVVWTKIANADLTAIIQYILSDNPAAAKDSLQRIKVKVSNLNSLPERGRIVPELRQPSPESVAAFKRNGRQPSTGIGGNLGPEYSI